jgi:hypothetical protein
MCGGVNDGKHSRVPVLLLRNPQDEQEPAPPTIATMLRRTEAREQEPNTPARKSRKLWELKRTLHCPVIGTCLDIDVWRRLARAQGFAVEEMSDYEVHIHFVGACGSRNSSSLAAQKALDRAHSSIVRRFARARGRDDLETIWQHALAEGEVPGGFWALVTHPRCDTGLTNQAYEDIHMLSHQIGAGQRADLQKLKDARLEIQQLRQELAEQQHRHRQAIDSRDRRLATLREQMGVLQEEFRATKARETEALQRLERLEDTHLQERLAAGTRQAHAADRRAEKLRSEVQTWREACELANTRADAWERDFREQHAQTEALERLLLQNPAGCSSCSTSDPLTCTNLCGRRILCVGGRSHVIEHYREIVSRCNGEFEHHDGGIEDKPQRLDALLSSADVVICAIDCVSHDAYNRSKRFCKRFAKPCVLLRSSGVSTFARALEQVMGATHGKPTDLGPTEPIRTVVMLDNTG